MTATVTPSDPLVIMFTSGSSGPPKGVVHSHGNALGAVRSGLGARAASTPTPGCICRCRSSGWAVSAAGCCPRCWPAPPWSPKRSRNPDTTLRCWNASGSRCFAAGPIRPRPWPGTATRPAPICRRCGRAAWKRCYRPSSAPQPGARATLFGMTESFGPYCGYPADTDMPRSAWGSCGKPFAGMEVRIVDPDTGAPVPAGPSAMIEIRGPHILRGICRRSREDLFTADGFYPTGDLGHLDDDGFLFYHGRSDDMFKVSGATVYPSEVERRCALSTASTTPSSPTCPALQGDRVGAAVVCEPRHDRRAAARVGAGSAQRLQGSDGVAAAGLRRRRSARHHRQGRCPSAARNAHHSARLTMMSVCRSSTTPRSVEVVDQRLGAGRKVLGHRRASEFAIVFLQRCE